MRTGKLKGVTKIILPYLEPDGTRQYSMLTITGTYYASKIYSIIRQFVKHNWDTDVAMDWLHNVPMIVNQHDEGMEVTPLERDENIERWIRSLEDDEIEDDTGSTSTTEDDSKAEQPLCSLSDSTCTSCVKENGCVS